MSNSGKSHQLRAVVAAATLVPVVGIPAAFAAESPTPSPSVSASPSVSDELPVLEVLVTDRVSLDYPGFVVGDAVVFVVRDASGREVHSAGVRVVSAGTVKFDVPVGSLGPGEYTVFAASNGYKIREQRLRVRAVERPVPSANPVQPPAPVPSVSAQPTGAPVQPPAPVPSANPVPSVVPVSPEPSGSSSSEPRQDGPQVESKPVSPVGSVNADPESRKKDEAQVEKVDPRIEVVRPSSSASASSGARDAAAVAAEREVSAAARQAPAVEPGDSSVLAAAPISRASVAVADSERVSGTSVVAAPISRGGGGKDQDAGKGAPVVGAPSRDVSSSPEASAGSVGSEGRVESASGASWGWVGPAGLSVVLVVVGCVGYWFLVGRRRGGASGEDRS